MASFVLVISVFIESFLFMGSGLSLIGVKASLVKIAYMGGASGLVAYGIRKLYEIYGIPLGTHSFIIIILLIAILKFIGKQNWAISIVAPLASFLLLSVGEGIFMFNIFRLLNIDLKEMMVNHNARLLGTFLTSIPLAIVFILGYVFNISVIDLNRLTKDEEA